jgi:hypothetical protein
VNPALSSHPVIKDFLWLTKYTNPYNSGIRRVKKFFTKLGCEMDKSGNFFLSIGKSRTLFAAHYDTADYVQRKVRRVISGHTIKTDGTSVLGADNRAGVSVLLHLIRHNIPGHYAFFAGEEVGRIGSTAAADSGRFDGEIDRVVCWDRMGETSIITHQMGRRCCSQEFATALAAAYSPVFSLMLDEGGTYTDSASFMDDVPECTNISVGYRHQHTHNEEQNAKFLVAMAEASVAVDWESLPVARDPHMHDIASAGIVHSYGRRKSTGRVTWNYYDDDRYTVRTPTVDAKAATYEYGVPTWDLLEYADRAILRMVDVEDFVYSYPEEAVKLLYQLLLEKGSL